MELAFPTASGYIAVPRSHPREDAVFNRGDSVCVAFFCPAAVARCVGAAGLQSSASLSPRPPSLPSRLATCR